MKRFRAACSLVLSIAAALPAAPLAAQPPGAQSAPAARESLVLRLTLNSEDKGDVFVERTADGDFLVKLADLRAVGFRDPPGRQVVLDGEAYLSLRSMRGLSFRFDEKQLGLVLTAEPQLLSTQSVPLEQRRARSYVIVPPGNSFFVNYALNATNVVGSLSRPLLSAEAGWRLGDFLLLTDGTTVMDELTGRRELVRLQSSLTHDDRAALRRTVIGDFFTAPRELSNGVNLGGLGISKLYAMEPDFIRYPMQTVSGAVALPSDLEVYIDGQRVRTERLKPGEFEIRDILAYGGARNVQLVLRDPFGRVQQYSYTFYFSEQPLRRGLHEYSYNIGALRRSYGKRSADYGPAAFSVHHRYGFTDALTLGVRAEGTRRLLNGGPLATVVLGDMGVAGIALSASRIADRRGAAVLASYSYQARHWNLAASLRRDWRDYAALGDPVVITNRHHEGTISLSRRLGAHSSMSLGHTLFRARGSLAASRPSPDQPFAISSGENRRVSTVSFTTPLVSGWASLNAGVSHIKDVTRGSRNELYANVNVFLGGSYSAAASHRADGRTNSQSFQFARQQPPGEGLGFMVGGDRWSDAVGSSLRTKGTVQYNAPAAIVRADLARDRDRTGQIRDEYRLSAAGGFGLVGDDIAFGRPITGSFGMVKIPGLAGVGVLLNGQRIGETDRRGRLFLPTLSAYLENDVSIAPETVPIEYSVSSISRRISPSLRGGTLVQFDVARLRALTGRIVVRGDAAAGAAAFTQGRIDAAPAPVLFQTGRAGEFYLEDLAPGSYRGQVSIGAKQCGFDLDVPESAEPVLELGEIACRMAP